MLQQIIADRYIYLLFFVGDSVKKHVGALVFYTVNCAGASQLALMASICIECSGMEIDMDYFNAFWVGGLVCALVQILLDKTKMLPGRIMVLLVCLGAILNFVGIFEPLQKFSGAGVSVPLLGFGNVLMKGVKEAIDKEGFLGMYSGGFKAGAVGCSAALIFGYLASLVFKPKMKK